MKKSKVLKALPNLKESAKRVTELTKMIPKLQKELTETQITVSLLTNVTLHEDFPVRVSELSGGFEVSSGCDEVTRSAFVKPVGDTSRFVVTTYQNDNHNVAEDGTPVTGDYKKNDALRLAKDYVASGKKTATSNEAPKKRGRPKKDKTAA